MEEGKRKMASKREEDISIEEERKGCICLGPKCSYMSFIWAAVH